MKIAVRGGHCPKVTGASALINELTEQLKQLITEAEINFPIEGSGELKKSEVLKQIYELLPNWMKTFVSYGMLSWLIEKTLVTCKKLWAENENIGLYIEQEKKTPLIYQTFL